LKGTCFWKGARGLQARKTISQKPAGLWPPKGGPAQSAILLDSDHIVKS
jgi:hypothetical protein